jgi:hypothetical protein
MQFSSKFDSRDRGWCHTRLQAPESVICGYIRRPRHFNTPPFKRQGLPALDGLSAYLKIPTVVLISCRMLTTFLLIDPVIGGYFRTSCPEKDHSIGRSLMTAHQMRPEKRAEKVHYVM